MAHCSVISSELLKSSNLKKQNKSNFSLKLNNNNLTSLFLLQKHKTKIMPILKEERMKRLLIVRGLRPHSP